MGMLRGRRVLPGMPPAVPRGPDAINNLLLRPPRWPGRPPRFPATPALS
jgi:hypothetical protein